MDSKEKTVNIIRKHLNRYAHTCDPKHEWESDDGARLERVLLFTKSEWQNFWAEVNKELEDRT